MPQDINMTECEGTLLFPAIFFSHIFLKGVQTKILCKKWIICTNLQVYITAELYVSLFQKILNLMRLLQAMLKPVRWCQYLRVCLSVRPIQHPFAGVEKLKLWDLILELVRIINWNQVSVSAASSIYEFSAPISAHFLIGFFAPGNALLFGISCGNEAYRPFGRGPIETAVLALSCSSQNFWTVIIH